MMKNFLLAGDREVHPFRVQAALRRPEHDVRGVDVLVRHRRRRLRARRDVRRIRRRLDGQQLRKVGCPSVWNSGICIGRLLAQQPELSRLLTHTKAFTSGRLWDA